MSNTAPIDQLRREMIAKGVPSEFAAIATGLAAEYAQRAHIQGYYMGYDVGKKAGQTLRSDATERGLAIIGSGRR